MPLEPEEVREAEERSAPPATVLYAAIYEEAVYELKRPVSALFWSGVAAGTSLGFSMIASGLIASMLPDAAWAPLVSNLGYTLGFLVVILGRQQLFTENALTSSSRSCGGSPARPCSRWRGSGASSSWRASSGRSCSRGCSD